MTTNRLLGIGVLLVTLLSSCQSSKYSMAGNSSAEGYRSVGVAPGTYCVDFIGSAYTPPATALRYVLLRAAHLTDSLKHDYFVVMDDSYLAFYHIEPLKASGSARKIVRMFDGTPTDDNPSAFIPRSVILHCDDNIIRD